MDSDRATASRHAWAATLQIDRALVSIEREIDILLNMTPSNVSEAWLEFAGSGFASVPTFERRPLGFDADVVNHRLFQLEIDDVEDAAVRSLFQKKRDELARQVMLLQDRGTERFVEDSLQLFGGVDATLLSAAEEVLAEVDPQVAPDVLVTATDFAERARRELTLYRSRYPGFGPGVEVRTDVPDLMVSHGRLLIGAAATFRARRVEALIHHEVGTHVVTYENGSAQPLQLLSVGLPGYDELQEGLAMLAEYVVGGLDSLRLRLIAARVAAVACLLEGAEFLEIFEQMHVKHGFAPRTAWSITVRTARGGGSTKDVIYLRGIMRLLDLIARGEPLEPLLIGKISFDDVAVIQDLLRRGVLKPPSVRPRWLDLPETRARLDRAAQGIRPLDLVEPALGP